LVDGQLLDRPYAGHCRYEIGHVGDAQGVLGDPPLWDFARRVGIGEPAAAARLRELTWEGLLERVPDQEPGQRARSEYQLTRNGRGLFPVITALRQWGDNWAAGPEGPAVRGMRRS
jgi:DNA-binding HxlR family transcriptional regulator